MTAAPSVDPELIEATEWSRVDRPKGTRRSIHWSDLVRTLSAQPRLVRVADAAWDERPAKWKKPAETNAYALASFKDDHRKKQNVERVYALSVEVDHGEPSFDAAVEAFGAYRGIVYSTFNSGRPHRDDVASRGPDAYRVHLLLSRPVSGSEYERLWEWLRQRGAALGFVFDANAKDPSRAWFYGVAIEGSNFRAAELTGARLDVDAVLANFRPEPATANAPIEPRNAPEPDWLAKVSTSTRVRRAEAYAARLEPAVSGEGGHNVKMRVASAIVRGFALSRGDALRVLTSWSARCEPPWSSRELEHAVDEAERVGQLQWGAKLREAEEPSTSSMAPKRSWADRLVTVERSWFTDTPPPRECLLRDLRTGRPAMPARGAALYVAAGGAGKSFASVALVIATATRTTWLGCLQPERAGKVLVITAEETAAELRDRFHYVARAYGVPFAPDESIDIIDIHDVHMPLLTPDAQPTEHAGELVAFVKAHGPYALTIVDPLARVSGASIDADNVAACALVTVLESVASASNGLVLGVHHTSQTARRAGLTDATAVRGATGLGDSARMVLVMNVETIEHADPTIADRLGEIVTVHAAKANTVRKFAPIQLRRNEHGVLVPLDAFDNELIAEARAGANRAARRETERAERRAVDFARADDAVVATVRDRPGIVTRELRAAVQVAARIGAKPVDEAIDRAIVSGRLRREGTKHEGFRHYDASQAPGPDTP